MTSAAALAFFLGMAGLTLAVNYSGLLIAAAFVSAILVCSFVSRWIRSTELRFEGFDFADEISRQRWQELRVTGASVLVPHRPGVVPLTDKDRAVRHDYQLAEGARITFIEAELGDPSNFYQKPLVRIQRDGGLEVIRVSRCVSVAHVLAAIGLELCGPGLQPPVFIFGWSSEPPLAVNLNFLLFGEGNIPWMVKELLRKSAYTAAEQPRIIIG
jgi:hypothetical protein